ncbi:class A beta-lactamase [Streptosporangium carneum]|uniref:Beta-lactamase n=1 Tax=Streptosporangium carneum TaxID=47481 RepID=A0A9W6MGI1_9ACTN|nr:class A beta-lactamase [Streptosporangium carneum]GLK13182.1 beta-lactamase [Streptosporangium carneum]
MRNRTGRFSTALKATGLLISVLAGAAACGTDTAATSGPAAPRAGAQDRRAVLSSPRTSSGEVEAHRRLRALEASFRGRVGAYAVDTATGETIAYRAGERFPLLSTFKALAAAAVLHKARTSDPGLMNRVVRWKRSDLKPNSPITEKHVDDGLTVARLCEAAITRSDNTAGNMLLRQIGGPAGLTRYLRTLKDPVSRLDRWETELNDWTPRERRDTTTPASAGGDLRALTVGDALTAGDRSRLNGWLRANETGDARIRAGLPKTWIIGDKTGTSASHGAANDIAVIRTSKTSPPLVMAVYTTRRAADAPADDKVVADTAAILARALGKLP